MSEYDDLLAAQASKDPAGNEYDALLAQQDARQRTQLRATMFGAVKVNPDVFAQATDLSAHTGIPAEVVSRNLDEVSTQQKLNEYDKLIQSSPALAAQLTNPNFANLAHDDTPALAGAEATVKSLGGQNLMPPNAPSYRQRLTDWTRNLFGLAPSGEVRDESAAAQAFIQLYAEQNKTTPAAMREAIGGQSEVFGQAAQGFVNQFSAGLAPDNTGDATSTAGKVAHGAGALGGFIAGAPLALAKGAYNLTVGERLAVGAGDSFVKALGKRAGQQALTLGAASGLEAAGTALDQNTPGHAAAIVGADTASGAVMGGIFGAAGSMFPDNTLGQFVLRAAATNAALDLANGTRPDDQRDLAQKVFDYGVNTFFSLHGAGRAGGGWLHDAQRADAALSDGQVLDQLNTVAEASKLRERSPESFAQFVQQATENGPVQDVYVAAPELMKVLEQAGVTADQAAQLSPALADQLATANLTGGDVRIPVSEYSARLAGGDIGKALLPHLRTSPEAMSQAEAQTFFQSHAETLKADAEKLLAEKTDQSAFQQSADAVHSNILDQLTTANRFTPDVNRAYASMVRDFYTVNADKLGLTPEQMYQRYPLNINAEGTGAGNKLDQTDQHVIPKEKQKGFYGGQIDAAESLSHADRQIEAKFAERILTSPDAAMAAYAKLEDARNGDTLNTDTARELSPDYLKDRAKAAAVHEPASWLVKYMYAKKLAEAKPGDRVLVSAGGTGAGKTTGLKKFGLETGLVYDTNMNTRSSAIKRIDQALTVKQHVDIVFTFRDPVEALQLGALTRAMNQEAEHGSGRTVPLSAHAETHTGSLGTIADLMQHYKADSRVKFLVIDNSHGKGNQKIVQFEDLKPKAYNDLHGALHATVEAEHKAGRISDAVRAGFLQGHAAQEPGSNDNRANGPAYSQDTARGKPEAARGQITLGENFPATPATISLLQHADLSTFLHESGHFFLEVNADIASRPDAPASIRQDFQTTLNWFGVKDQAEWRALSFEQKRPFHEQFARGFEAYLFEGKSPNLEMQSVYSRFRDWLLNVYKSISALGVNLTDEVRSVFDRMLATENQIHLAEAAQKYAPVFADAKQAGMTPDEWHSYQTLGAAATGDAIEALQKRSLRDMKWLSGAKSKALKELQADAAAKRQAVREEVSAEVRAEPVYAARRFIHDKETGAKFSLSALKTLYGDAPDAVWHQLPKGFIGEEGLHPDQIAELFGFGSGDELIHKLVQAPPEKEVIDAHTDQRMLERYGDLNNPATIERAADQAIHNAARTRFVATELRSLEKAAGPRKTLITAAKAFAEQMISRLKVRNLKPAQYTAAELRAAKASEKLIAEGKTAEAASEKRNQLLSNYAARAAMEAGHDVEKGVEYLKKFSKDAVRKALGQDYVDQIDRLLERFDLRKSTTLGQIDKRKSLAKWIESQEALGYEPVIDDELRAEAFSTSYKDLTIEQFRGLVDAVRNIEHLGRLKAKLLSSKDKREFAEAVSTAEAAIRGNAKRTLPPELEHNSKGQQAKAMVDGFFAMHRKFANLVQEMDGFKDGGPLWELFVRPSNAAGDMEATRREQATIKLTEIFKPIRKSGKLRTKLYIPAIDASLSREGRLAIALNWGNEVNRKRVMDGEKWTEPQVRAVLDTLTKEDWDFVQAMWDHIDSYWPEIKAKEERVTGLAPEKSEAIPVDTKHGQYKGGYYPIKYDPLRSSKAEADDMAESLKSAMQGLYTRATTRRGHVKARVDTVERPMRKDLGVAFEHINQVIHDLSWHEYLIDANRLLRSGAIDGAIRDHYGPQALRVMRSALDDVARGDIPAQTFGDRAVRYVRTGSTISGLAWSLSTALLQPIGLTQSMARIGPKYVVRGLTHWLTSGKRMEDTVEGVYAKSEFMRLRGKTMQREINEIRNQLDNRDGVIGQSFFYLINKLQVVADMPTWLGQYEKATDQGADDAKAIAMADQAVIDAQGSGHIKDLAQVQRGGEWLKLWTNFYSFFNTTYNLSVDSVKSKNLKKPGDIAILGADFLLLMTIPALMQTLLHAALQGDDKGLGKKIVQDQFGYMAGNLVGVRELSGAIQGQQDYRGPAGARVIGAISKLITDVEAGNYDAKHLLRDLNAAGGILFHYPAGQVDRTARGFEALANGDTANPGVLVTGPAPKK